MKTKKSEGLKHQPIYEQTFKKLQNYCYRDGRRVYYRAAIASEAIEEYLEKHKGE